MKATLLALLLCLPFSLAARDLVVGVVVDGYERRALIDLSTIEAEMNELPREDARVTFPANKQLSPDGGMADVNRALDTLFADPEVDVVLTLGILASGSAAGRPDLPKPVVAATVADPNLENFPLGEASSGKRNFAYTSNFLDVADEIRNFREAVGFEELVVFADATVVREIPELERVKAPEIEKQLGVGVTLVPVGADIEAALAMIPEGVTAAFLTPLGTLEPEAMRNFVAGLNARGIATWSMAGVSELDYGVLMADSGRPKDRQRLARRLALIIQRIALGEEPASIPVAVQENRRLAINMQTARLIGYYPRRAMLVDAEQYFPAERDGNELGLNQALDEAVRANLGLQAAAYDPLIAQEDIAAARAGLLPQVSLEGGWQKVDEDLANGLVRAEESTDAQLVGELLLYSDNVWAGYRVAEYLKASADEQYRADVLDTLQAAGVAYLNLLRAVALESVQRSNLEVTRTNLELARVRESVGFSGRSDVLRWESQIANDRRNLIEATAAADQTRGRLNQVLHRDQNQRLEPLEDSVDQSLALFTNPRFLALIDNEQSWTTLKDFAVDRALRMSPEVATFEGQLLASERQVEAAQRRFFVPDLVLRGTGNENIDRSGLGADLLSSIQDDTTWEVGVFASLPLLSGGRLRADLNRARYTQRQLESAREATAEEVEALARIAMDRAAGSYPAIELTEEAARAAEANLKIVTDAYSKGAVNVTDLVDAQNSALAAGLAAAEARYLYLIDVIAILRITGDFAILLDKQSVNDWFAEVEEWFRVRGVPLPRAIGMPTGNA